MRAWERISPGFSSTEDFLSGFTINSFNDAARVDEYCEFFSLHSIWSQVDADAFEAKPIEPDYGDLARLHYLVLKRKVITTLELGSGFSTVAIAAAKRLLSQHFADWASANVHVDTPFHLYSVEESEHFLQVTKSRLNDQLGAFVSLFRSSVEMIVHDGRIATLYSRLPNVAPDLIYMDGPSQYATTAELNGFSISHKGRMPMSADILRFEFFLEPGTLVLVDGRTANARFLKAYLKRDWAYVHDPVGDVHYFELQEQPLGKLNASKIDFCLGGDWLLDPEARANRGS